MRLLYLVCAVVVGVVGIVPIFYHRSTGNRKHRPAPRTQLLAGECVTGSRLVARQPDRHINQHPVGGCVVGDDGGEIVVSVALKP